MLGEPGSIMPVCHILGSKMNFVFLCAFGLLAIVHGQEPSADELKKYSLCFEYALCKDPSTRKEFISCHSAFGPKDFQSFLQYFENNFYPLSSDTLSGAISEYCTLNEAAEQTAASKLVDANFSFQKKTAADGEGRAGSELEQTRVRYFFFTRFAESEGHFYYYVALFSTKAENLPSGPDVAGSRHPILLNYQRIGGILHA
ncbi:hypothetical protein AVEN_44508-1 [Araneus ventricosus]|uniref:Uncharacterized protein n=1 Tax=Araneus ventricosus TaxID=182803 RepID=A0A4Y2NTA3_ARAVE|nr:hypothetical protein AVEN_44508-1 [Araneus ventricosus]